MKNILSLLVIFAMLTACSDDNLQPDNPSASGSGVTFGASVSLNPLSRTIYGNIDDLENNATTWPIYWLNNDMVNIYATNCETEAGGHQAPYKITVPLATDTVTGLLTDGTPQTSAGKLTASTADLQWGSGNSDFYSVYPYIEGTENFNVGEDGKVKMSARVDPQQTLNVPLDTTTNLVNGKKVFTVFAKGDMNNNIMYATTKNVNSSTGKVNLKYHPVSTVLQLDFSSYVEMALYEITITSPTAFPIAGTLNITDDNGATYTLTPDATSPNSVTLSTHYFNRNTTFPTQMTIPESGNTPGDENFTIGHIIANVFIAVPSSGKNEAGNDYKIYNTGNSNDNWTITIKTNSGTYTRNLTNLGNNDTGTTGSQTNTVLKPGQIHKITLPVLGKTSGFWTAITDDLKQWMNTIPDNVYLSELTLPGAYNATNLTYQYDQDDNDPQHLLNKGCRSWYVPTYVAYDNNNVKRLAVYKGDEKGWFSDYINNFGNIGSDNGAQKTEFGVIVVGHVHGVDLSGKEWNAVKDEKGNVVSEQYWLEAIKDFFQSFESKDQYKFLYTNEIGVNTTLGEVRENVVIKVNVSEGSKLPSGQTISPSTWNIPGLISFTSNEWVRSTETEPDQANLPLVSHMFWDSFTSDDEINMPTLDNLGSHSDALHWAYSNGGATLSNSITNTDGLNYPTMSERKNALMGLVNWSKSVYDHSDHNVWFFFNCGGGIVNVKADGTLDTDINREDDVVPFATEMNSWVYNLVNDKISNGDASPLGIVTYDLYAGQNDAYHCYGPFLSTALVKMNYSFYLKRDETKSTSTKAASRSGAKLKEVENGWYKVEY